MVGDREPDEGTVPGQDRLTDLPETVAALRRTNGDLERALAAERARAQSIESELGAALSELREQQAVSSRLRDELAKVERQRDDLEVLVQTITEHSDQVDQQWVEKFSVAECDARTDCLTGVPNRRGFDEALEREWGRAHRDGKPVSLLLFDIDFFKKYNDRYGHPAGDACLQQVAAAAREVCRRATDVIARYGGEEFALILPGADYDSALEVAESLRRRIAGLRIPNEGSLLSDHVTISVGVASCSANPHCNYLELVGCVDRGLYDAKEHGRNRVAGSVCHRNGA